MAATLSEGDPELNAWIGLRLISSLHDTAGIQTSMARLNHLKRSLTHLGDPRPFAAFHLWIAEVETQRGQFENATRHLEIAKGLISQIDDLWLQGYLAINNCVVNYSSAKIPEARKWAETALNYAIASGHAATQRAAHANLGHIEFSLGHFKQARTFLENALYRTESGSPSHIAILDSIAQISLHSGDLAESEQLINQLEGLALGKDWPSAIQARLKLLLKQGRPKDAQHLCDSLSDQINSLNDPRESIPLRILSIEATLASAEFERAARELKATLLKPDELPLDILGEVERIIGKTLCLDQSHYWGQRNLNRAIEIFDFIGHVVGRTNAASDREQVGIRPEYSIDQKSARLVLDQLRVALDTRGREEPFLRELAKLLSMLECTSDIRIEHYVGDLAPKTPTDPDDMSIAIDSSGCRMVFRPKSDVSSAVAAAAFRRLVDRILRLRTSDTLDVSSNPWPLNESLPSGNVVFASNTMSEILGTINRIAATNLAVLITGETGTGKEVIAKTLHERSDRAQKPFLALNCAAVPRDLLESQLFGYRRGAFSGATDHFPGVIRAANGGTLFLDEIGEMPLEMQPKLLRFLESGEIHPLGETQPTKVDVRLVFATNANLDELLNDRRFRSDLLFRINTISLQVPPLRERREEIPLLVNLFAERFSREFSKPFIKFSPEAIEHLVFFDWPGNVRQLSNEIRRLIALTNDRTEILPAHLSPQIVHPQRPASSRNGEGITVPLDQKLSEAVKHVEHAMLDYALKKTNGRVDTAAKALGLSRKGLYLKRQRLGMLRNNET